MFAVVDVETTGGAQAYDRITEIAILIHNGKRIVETFCTLVNPQQEIDPFVVALTGISNEMVENAPLFEEIFPKVEELTKNKVLVAHNARFDYGILRKEYKYLGEKFQRKHLCTVKLAKKIFPGLKSYSLGNLCKNLEIPVLNRHRAFGDAEATTVLFEMMMFNERKELIYSELNNELNEQILPPNISKKQVEDLPDETGVYYFINEKDQILYIGKSTNIKQRVISHFSSDLKKARFADLKNQVHKIDYKLTGNDLIAQLLESSEIKRNMPPFNRAQRRKKYRYGIFIRKDEMGLDAMQIGTLKLDEQPLILCTSRRSAALTLERFEKKYQLDIFKQLAKLSYKSTRRFEKVKEIYMDRLNKFILDQQYPHDNFVLVGEGLNAKEHSIVCVENGQYKGFGYIADDVDLTNQNSIAEWIEFAYDTPDIKRIIKGWIKKHKGAKIIPY